MATQKSNPSAAQLFQYQQSPYMEGNYEEKNTPYGMSGQVNTASGASEEFNNAQGQKSEAKKGPNDFQTGFEKGSAGGMGLGGAISSAGMYATMGGNPYGLAAVGGGMVISGIEQQQKNKQIDEANRIKAEEQQREAQISAINNLMGIARGLNV